MKNKKLLYGSTITKRPKKCLICEKSDFTLKFKYSKKPPIETNFNIKDYGRSYFSCKFCSHWTSNLILSQDFYYNHYVENTYKNKYFEKFKKIINLKKSDNNLRVERISNFLSEKKINLKKNILDVGSGLGIFPYKMKKNFTNTYSLDPDRSMSFFLKKKLNLNHFFCDFEKLKTRKKFNLITFNKVIEHVNNPKKFLSNAIKFLADNNSYIYIELPDTETAEKVSKNREEFCIEHINCFTLKSLDILLYKCSLKRVEFKRIIEPSGKMTMYCFAQKK